ncbi:nucleotidyltransferase family protein [Streptomyces alanosinicus]|uniref:Glucose-1-phosphate cytidylyltransferase n=1 Tax=Streptomyces alanosinicus TaxID=68171 RepID=A0A918YJZ9_9ACTN|nr:sugar phosphate nucleotidyltransferase [Streptomyces alanosinicus]GHE06684.1 glucose-1-phosphate cytidylyltransferase [Streptomyces alanosinicus]
MMDVVILCGGRGTRLFPATATLPKLLVPIGPRTMLELLIAHLEGQGIQRVILCAGYRASEIISFLTERSVEPVRELGDGDLGAVVRGPRGRPVEVVAADTGLDVPTGARIHRISPYLRSQECMVVYGDVLGDVAVDRLLHHHRWRCKSVTVTTAKARSPFGHVIVGEQGQVRAFQEKPVLTDPVNIGFMVLDRTVVADELNPHSGQLEEDLLRRLAVDGQLSAFEHDGHFEKMDTLADRERLEGLWKQGELDWLTAPVSDLATTL